MDINEGINQEGLKQQAGIKNKEKSTPNAGRNYANRINNLAQQRMEKYRRNIRVMDMLQAVNRYQWGALPLGLRSKLIERICYYRGNAMGYWDYDLNKYFLLPYSLTAEDDQNIDFYGQYTRVKPYSFNGKSTDNRNPTAKGGRGKNIYLGTITRIPVYDMEELKALMMSKTEDWCRKNLCIILRDYTQQMTENNVPRSITQEAFIDFQSEALPMMRTAMLKACMPKLVKTSDEGVVDSLLAELDTIENSIIEGKTMIPVTAFQDLQEIDNKNSGQVIESMMKCYESINNIRKTFLGIPNDGAFKKNAHTLQDEQDTNQQSSDSILDDGLELRQEFADMFNRLFGLKITVKVKDKMGDGTDTEDEPNEDEPAGEQDGEGSGQE